MYRTVYDCRDGFSLLIIMFRPHYVPIFNAYIESIFLYNAELWILTKKTCRRHQHFPKVTVKENFKKTHGQRRYRTKISIPKQKPLSGAKLSKKIQKRRLLWIGHLYSLRDAPAKQPLTEGIRKLNGQEANRRLRGLALFKRNFTN